ncbi:glycoside hydrolase domain-containing protein, partial [Cutibacterium acnes]
MAFTPPLDTKVGGERPTVQLVGVNVTNGKYSFDFSKLKRFVDMCLGLGVEYFEMSHLFTQWGAAFAPKVIATVDGVEK